MSLIKNGVYANAPATNVRWRIFLILLLLGAINYIDKTSLAIAMPYIVEEFNIQDTIVVGLLHSTFFWAYALMQVPSRVLADKFKREQLLPGQLFCGGMRAAQSATM